MAEIPTMNKRHWKNERNDCEKLFEKVTLELQDANLPLLINWVEAWREYLFVIKSPSDPTGRVSYNVAIMACTLIRVLIASKTNIGPENLDRAGVLEIKKALHRRFHTNTVRSVLKHLRYVLEFLVAQRKLSFNVVEIDLLPKKAPIRRDRVSPADAYSVAVAAINTTYRRLPVCIGLLLLANTGLRIAEFWDLRASAFVPEHESLGPHLVLMGKGDRERFVPLTKAFAIVLKKYIKIHCPRPETDFLFHRAAGGDLPVCLSIFKKVVKRVERKIGHIGPTCSSLNIRRGLARHLHSRGMRLDLIQRLYGHEDIRDTKGYVGKDESRIFEELNATHPSFYRQLDNPVARNRPKIELSPLPSPFKKLRNRQIGGYN